MLEDFSQVTRFRVPYADIDMMQHVNHIAYIRWAEEARAGYIADVLKENIHSSQGIILAKLEFSYERQLDYHEDVAIGCRIARLGSKSLDFSYEIWSATHVQRAAFGSTPCVAFDYERNASILIPQDWRTKIAAFEKKPPH